MSTKSCETPPDAFVPSAKIYRPLRLPSAEPVAAAPHSHQEEVALGERLAVDDPTTEEQALFNKNITAT